MNRDTRWDANQAIVAPGSVKDEKVGLIIVALTQPSQFNPKFWRNVVDKILSVFIPWPINIVAAVDRGIVVMDPDRPYAPNEFTPNRLADINGSETDLDGTRWIDRYKKGELTWVNSSGSIPFDTGFFLYTGREQGMPTGAAKTSVKARYLYYAQLKDAYLPHGDQTIALGADAIAALRQRYPQIIAGEFVDAFDPPAERATVRRILDQGAETLLLGSGQPINSDFEEMKGSYSKIKGYVDEWRAEHGNKPIKIVVAPYMASEPAFDKLWLDHFEATVPLATAPGQTAYAMVSLHGVPPSIVQEESWSKRWPIVSKRLEPQMAAILRKKGYAITKVTTASEAFADPVEDPDNEIVSVNELFKEAKAKKAAVAIALPIEFLAENTDTLFAHQSLFFDGIAGYKPYAPPPLTQDWQLPYVRRLQDGPTTIIYAGALGGAKQKAASEVLATAIGRVFPTSAKGSP
jgi:protoheme ferro-lyase